jgi:hypothetical protein
LSRLSYVRVTRIGWPATGTSRSTNDTVKCPTFRLSRTTTIVVARAVRPALSVAKSRSSWSPFSISDGSSRPSTAFVAAAVPLAKAVHSPSPRSLCSSVQRKRSPLATVPTTSLGALMRAPAAGDASETAGGAPVAVPGFTTTASVSLPKSAPSPAVSRST